MGRKRVIKIMSVLTKAFSERLFTGFSNRFISKEYNHVLQQFYNIETLGKLYQLHQTFIFPLICRESEDTILMMLKETYALLGIAPQRPGSPSKTMLPPPPMASPPGSLLASPVHSATGLPPVQHPSLISIGSPSAVGSPGAVGSMGTLPGGMMPPPPTQSGIMNSPPGMQPWQPGAPTSQPGVAPVGPPPMSGFVRK